MCQTEIDISVNDEEEPRMKISRVGVDLAKNVFQLHGVDRHGKTVWKRQLPRDKWLQVLIATVEPGAMIGMEACTGAHHWSRILHDQGYQVKIIPPQFVKPFVKSNKNDANDAQAICEAIVKGSDPFYFLVLIYASQKGFLYIWWLLKNHSNPFN